MDCLAKLLPEQLLLLRLLLLLLSCPKTRFWMSFPYVCQMLLTAHSCTLHPYTLGFQP